MRFFVFLYETNLPYMNTKKLLPALLVCLLMLTSLPAFCCRKPVLKKTRWTAVQEMFVADAGTMTITYTLDFISKKEVRIKEESFLPAHPAMYMNPDGTVDRIPARSSESEEAGTYRVRRGILTITTEDGRRQDYTIREDGTITRQEPYGETLIFQKQALQP